MDEPSDVLVKSEDLDMRVVSEVWYRRNDIFVDVVMRKRGWVVDVVQTVRCYNS